MCSSEHPGQKGLQAPWWRARMVGVFKSCSNSWENLSSSIRRTSFFVNTFGEKESIAALYRYLKCCLGDKGWHCSALGRWISAPGRLGGGPAQRCDGLPRELVDFPAGFSPYQ